MEYKTIEIPESYQDLYVVGDIHGEFETLVYNLTSRYRISNSVIIIAGDCGLGFESLGHYENLYNKISKKLDRDNLMILCVRGNHDNPEYYNGDLRLDYERLKSLPDYTYVKIRNREILCVGGAVSVDKDWRISENAIQERMGRSNRVWWPSEAPLELDENEINKRLPGLLYCMVSHDAPISFMPVLQRDGVYVKTDEMFFDILHTREYLEKLLWRCKPRRWYYGHHHESHSGTNGVTQFRCLGIQELIRVPIEEDDLPEEKENSETRQ